MCLVLSWNNAFLAMCIVALLSSYSLRGYSGGNQFLSINFWSRSVLMSHLPCLVLRLCIEPKDHILFLTFLWHKLSSKKDNIMWSTSYQNDTQPDCIWEVCCSGMFLIWIEKPSSGVFFRYLKIFIIISKWVVLGANKNWITTLTANVISGLIIVRKFSFLINLLYLLTSLRSFPWSSSNFVFTFIIESILLHPSILASESKLSIYFLCDRRMFLNLANSISKKYFKDSRYLVWKCFCKYFFRLSIPFVSSYVIIISFTYTTSRIFLPSCIRQNTEWSFFTRQSPNSWITNSKHPN